MKLKTKDLLTLAELTPKEFVDLIDYSIKLKKELKKGGNKPILKNKTLTMIFQKPSTRTRVSFLRKDHTSLCYPKYFLDLKFQKERHLLELEYLD